MGVAHGLRQAFAPDSDLAVNREGIDRFDPYPIQPHGLLEGFGVDLPTGIHLARRIDELAERDTTAIVTYRHLSVLDGDLDLLTCAHDVLVNRVIEHLLQ